MCRYLLTLLGVFFLLACQSNKPTGTTPFKVDFFKTVPDTIEGCSKLYTYDTTDIASFRYIFVANFADFAIIKVNGKDIYMKNVTTEKVSTISKSDTSQYEGNGYKATLTLKEIESYEEVGRYEGTLEIIKDRHKVILKIHGLSGC
jgi:hypothetical protein